MVIRSNRSSRHSSFSTRLAKMVDRSLSGIAFSCSNNSAALIGLTCSGRLHIAKRNHLGAPHALLAASNRIPGIDDAGAPVQKYAVIYGTMCRDNDGGVEAADRFFAPGDRFHSLPM